MIRRATILVLASVLSLCATQPVTARDARGQEVPAVIRLAESRSEKAIKLRILRPQFNFGRSADYVNTRPSAEPQVFPSPASPRAPPALPA